MAEKRMFAKTIVDSDAFLDMSLSTQALYFHLSMRADDDGFINNPKKIMRMIGASDDDLKILIAKRFVLTFETGVIVIKHWRLHNTLRKDRYKPTIYQEEFLQLKMKDDGAYTENHADIDYQVVAERLPSGCQMVDVSETEEKDEYKEINGLDGWCQSGNQLATQNRLGKDRLDNNHNNLHQDIGNGCNTNAKPDDGIDCFDPIEEQMFQIASNDLKNIVDDPDAIVSPSNIIVLAKSHGIQITNAKREELLSLCSEKVLTVDHVRQCIRLSKTARYKAAYLITVLTNAVQEPNQYHTDEYIRRKQDADLKRYGDVVF